MASDPPTETRQWNFVSSIDNASSVVAEIFAMLEEREWSGHDLFAVHLAIDEAIVNAVRHGNKFDESKSVQVTAEVGHASFFIEVIDEGAGFNPADVPDPTADENLDKPSGRGVMLMKSFMTEVDYLGRGNHLRMRKDRG